MRKLHTAVLGEISWIFLDFRAQRRSIATEALAF